MSFIGYNVHSMGKTMKPNARGTVRERMERDTIPEPMSGCHLWIGDNNSTGGYGRIWANGRTQLTHRVAWTLAKGAIPAGKMGLHKCDNPPCVDVDHLYIGDGLMNTKDRVARGRDHNAKKTHCPRGHEYTTANTLHPDRDRIHRRCRACITTWNRAGYVARVRRAGKEIQA